MLTTTLNARAALGDLVLAARELALALAEADAAQWLPAVVVKPHEDTTERSQGAYSDPTFATATDERRLAVRAAVVEAERALHDLTRAVERVTHEVDAAVDAWAGHRDEAAA